MPNWCDESGATGGHTHESYLATNVLDAPAWCEAKAAELR